MRLVQWVVIIFRYILKCSSDLRHPLVLERDSEGFRRKSDHARVEHARI